MSIDSPVLEQPTVVPPPARGVRAAVRRAASNADVRRSVLSVVDQAIVSGTSFATSVLIGRLCSPTELGVYFLALSVWLLVRGVQEQLVVAPYMIYSPRRSGGELASYFGSSLVHNGALTLGAMLGLLGLAFGVTNGFGPVELGTTAWVMLGTVPCLALREFVRHYAFSHLRMGMALAIDLVVATCQICGLLLLGWTGTLTVASAYVVIGGACAVAALGWFLARPQAMRIERSSVIADWRHNWSFARWALACHLFTSATPLVMPWVIAFSNGAAATGVLAACTTIIGLANVFVMGLSNLLSPLAAHAYGRGGVEELGWVLRKTLLLFTATLGAFAVLTLFAGGTLVTLVYGDQYAGAGPIVAVLAFATLAASVGITAGNGLWAMERPSANLRADVWAFVAAVVATVLLVPSLGVLGAALVTLIANVVDAAVRSVTLRGMIAERRRAEA